MYCEVMNRPLEGGLLVHSFLQVRAQVYLIHVNLIMWLLIILVRTQLILQLDRSIILHRTLLLHRTLIRDLLQRFIKFLKHQ